MLRILNKRLLRELKTNFIRYLALFILILLGMYLTISIIGAADSVIDRVQKAAKANQVEDGEFSVFVPLDTDSIQKLRGKGLTIEEAFYLDFYQKDSSILRIYKNRSEINRIEVEEGALAAKVDEIVLEKLYAKKHGLTLGSELIVAGITFKVTGIASSPDYDLPLKNITDSSAQSNIFGLGFVTADAYALLKSEGKASKSEEYTYSYLLNGTMTSMELKDYLCGLEFDKSKITDPFFLEYLNQLEKTKNEILNGVKKLSDGSKDLNQGLTKLSGQRIDILNGTDLIFEKLLADVNRQFIALGLKDRLTGKNYEAVLDKLIDQADKSNSLQKESLLSIREKLSDFQVFKEGMTAYTEGVRKAADGSGDLLLGVNEWKDRVDRLVNDNFTVDIDNLTQFIEKEDNPRIEASVDDVLINRTAGIVAGIIVMILFTYVISVFVIQGIERESSVVGALYALGVTKRQLVRHYLRLPIILTFFAGVTGTLLGFSPIGVNYHMMDAITYFSTPAITTIYPLYLILYGCVMPPIVAVLVNYLVISRKLSQPTLRLLRNEKKYSKITNIDLHNLKFIPRFQIRQFLREIRAGLTVVFGMFIALLIMMIGINCYVLCHNLSVNNKKDTTYNYMYSYKYPTGEVPVGGEACYIKALKREVYGYNLDVTLLGIDKDNQYFQFKASEGKNKVTISDALATKYGLSIGDKLVLSDEINERDYAFTIDHIVSYSIGLYAFMDLDSMRELFGEEDNYYNVILSGKDLNIDAGRLYATTTKEDISKGADVFIDNLMSLVISMIASAIIIFAVVMYLMMKVMMDRSAYHISLFKVFGYKNKEIRKLYLNGNFILVAVSAVFCIPLAKAVIDYIYPYFISNVATGMDLTFTFGMYLRIYIGVMACYFVINEILIMRVKKLMPAEILKNKE